MERSFKVNNFDLLRIIAATQVLFLHSIGHLHIGDSLYFTPVNYFSGFNYKPIRLSPLHYFPGVPIFFTISGYLISASYERNNSLKNYFKNRFLRIYPGLWGCLFLTILLAGLLGFSLFNLSAIIWLLSQMFGIIYTPSFLKNFGFGSYNGSLWTIPIELQFYIVLPFIYILIGQKKATNSVLFLLFFLFVIFAMFMKLLLPNMGMIYDSHQTRIEKLMFYSFVPHFYLFLAGVIMQRLKFYKSNWIRGKAIYWFAGYLGVAIFTLHIPILSIFSMLLLSVFVISMAYTGTGLAYMLLKNNDISYGVYIYHGLILNILVSYNLLYQPIYLLVVLLGSYGLGYCSWVFIEKPCLRRKKAISNELSNAPLSTYSISRSNEGV